LTTSTSPWVIVYEAGLVERLVDRARVLVEHDAEAVPGRLAHAEDAVVVGEFVSPWRAVLLCVNVDAGAGACRSGGCDEVACPSCPSAVPA
jgi:hypothetical protein